MWHLCAKDPTVSECVLAWTVIGFVDFLTAVFLGAASQPGTPIRLFFEAPGTALLGDLPWRFIPAYYVPMFLILHIAIFMRLLSRPPQQLASASP
jgi:hypothetical protein